MVFLIGFQAGFEYSIRNKGNRLWDWGRFQGLVWLILVLPCGIVLKVLFGCVMVSAFTFPVASANAGVYRFASIGIHIQGKGLILLLASGAGVPGVSALVWLKYVLVYFHVFALLCNRCNKCNRVLQVLQIVKFLKDSFYFHVGNPYFSPYLP